jgi:hypothetical protein
VNGAAHSRFARIPSAGPNRIRFNGCISANREIRAPCVAWSVGNAPVCRKQGDLGVLLEIPIRITLDAERSQVSGVAQPSEFQWVDIVVVFVDDEYVVLRFPRDPVQQVEKR